MDAVDDKTFTIKVKQPFPLLLEASASRRATCRSSCRSGIAKTDPFQQMTDATGSGPFKFVRRRMGAGQQGRLRQEHRLRAAQGARRAGPPAARSSRSTASSGSTSPTRPPRPRRISAGEVDYLGADAARPDPGPGAQPRRHGREHRSAGQHGRAALQPPASRRSTTRRCARRCSTSSTSRTT